MILKEFEMHSKGVRNGFEKSSKRNRRRFEKKSNDKETICNLHIL